MKLFGLGIAIAIALFAVTEAASAPLVEPERRRPTETTSTTTSTTTTLPVPADAYCGGWWNLAREVGWSEENLPKLDYVIYRESRCLPEAFNAKDPNGGSAGLTQIKTPNDLYHYDSQYLGTYIQLHSYAHTNLILVVTLRNQYVC